MSERGLTREHDAACAWLGGASCDCKPAAHPDSRVAGAERLADSAEALLRELEAEAGVIADGPSFDRLVRWIKSRQLAAPQTRQPAEGLQGDPAQHEDTDDWFGAAADRDRALFRLGRDVERAAAEGSEPLPLLHIEVDEAGDEHEVAYVVDDRGKAVGRLAAPQTRQPAGPSPEWEAGYLAAIDDVVEDDRIDRAAAEGSEPLGLAAMLDDELRRVEAGLATPQSLRRARAVYASQTSEDAAERTLAAYVEGKRD